MENMATKTNRKSSAGNTKPAVRYIVDADGKRTEVVLPVVPWEEVKKQLGE